MSEALTPQENGERKGQATQITLIELADRVRAALIEFGHTGEIDLVKKSDLHDIYNLACDALGQEMNQD